MEGSIQITNQKHDFRFCTCKTCGSEMTLCLDMVEVKYYGLCKRCEKYAAVDIPTEQILGGQQHGGRVIGGRIILPH